MNIVLIVMACLISFMVQTCATAAERLSGSVSQTEVSRSVYIPKPIFPTALNNTSSSESAELSTPNELMLDKLQRQLATVDPSQTHSVPRPHWIPLHAYTNDAMIGRYGNILPWLRWGQPIPASGVDIQMLSSITRYWRNGTYGTCMIHCLPIYGAPGNFTFYTVGNVNGPQGWLQDTGQCEDRHRLYRYWFNQ